MGLYMKLVLNFLLIYHIKKSYENLAKNFAYAIEASAEKII